MYRISKKSPHTWLVFYLFHYVCTLWLGMTLRNLVTLHGNKHVKKPHRANAHICIFSLAVMCCVSLIMADASNYSIECLVVFWCMKDSSWVRQIHWWQCFSLWRIIKDKAVGCHYRPIVNNELPLLMLLPLLTS